MARCTSGFEMEDLEDSDEPFEPTTARTTPRRVSRVHSSDRTMYGTTPRSKPPSSAGCDADDDGVMREVAEGERTLRGSALLAHFCSSAVQVLLDA